MNRAVPAAELDATVDELVEKLAAKLPQTVRYTKQQLNFWRDLAWHETVNHARDWLALSMATEEPKAAVEKFLERAVSVVLVEREAPIAVVLLNRPEALNALNDEVMGELVDALTALDDEDEIRCIVLGGSERAFAAGADIGQMAEASAMEMYEARRIDRWDAIRRVRTPLVAAVSGFCLGGGNELAMACDLIVASETAQFGQPETGLGIIPGAGGTQRLTRAVGKAKAMDVILSGRFLTAEEAERAGLVARVVAKEAWLEEAKRVARAIAVEGPGRAAPGEGVRQPRVRDDAGDRPRLRAQGALPRVRLRGRPRGPDGVHREAQAGIPRPLGRSPRAWRPRRAGTTRPGSARSRTTTATSATRPGSSSSSTSSSSSRSRSSRTGSPRIRASTAS